MKIMILYFTNGVRPLTLSDYSRFINDFSKEAGGNTPLTFTCGKNEYTFSNHSSYSVYVAGFVYGRDAFLLNETRAFISAILRRDGNLLYGALVDENKHIFTKTSKFFQFYPNETEEHEIYLINIDGSVKRADKPIPSLDSERVELDVDSPVVYDQKEGKYVRHKSGRDRFV